MSENQKKQNATFVALVGLIGLTAIIGLVLTSTKVFADDVVDDVAVTVPTSCTMSGSGMTSHGANLQNGSYTPNIGTTTMNVFCNDTNGFSIYAIGNSGDTLGEADSTKLLGTSASGNAKIVTGTATTAGSPDVSNWAMKLATDSQATYPLTIESDTEGSFASYHTVPAEYTKVATRLSGTDTGSNATGSTLTTTYAAYISKTQAADTYTGKVKYVLVHPNDAPTPVVPPAPATSCNTPVPNITYMQDITSSNIATVLASLTEDAPYYLRDSRDKEPYCVSKLKDGNLWLLDNLRLDLSDADTLAAVAETNTNASATSLSYLKNGGGTTSDQYAITSVAKWTDSPTYTSDYSYSDPLIVTSVSGWSKDTTITSNGSGKIGVYYNYCAASAGSYCYGNGTSYGTSTGDATEDLCPAGWRMPTGGDSGEYQALYTAYSSDATNYRNALSTPLSGDFYNIAYGQGTYGAFWSSTRINDYVMYILTVGSSVTPVNGNSRYYGYSMRCLLDSQFCLLSSLSAVSWKI